MANRPPVAATAIRLTPSARAYADRQGLTKTIEAAAIGPDAMVGDLVSFGTAGDRQDFTLVARRWLASDGATVLELTLDHPVRRGS